MKTSKPAVTSDISPWLTALVYPLGRHVVLPFYFGSIEVVGREHLPTLASIVFGFKGILGISLWMARARDHTGVQGFCRR